MAKLDGTTKSILIGVGAAVALGVGVFSYFAASSEAQEKAKGVYNRQRAKHYAKSKFGKNNHAEKMIDKMSDSDINNLLGAADKASDLEDQLSDAMSDVGNFFSKKTKQAKKALK